jgi:hypothetical protein
MLTFAQDFYEKKAEVLKILREGNSKRREESMKRNYRAVFKLWEIVLHFKIFWLEIYLHDR